MAAARPRDRARRRDKCIGGSDAQDCCYCPCTRHGYCPVAAFAAPAKLWSSLLVSQTASSRLLPTVPCPQQRSDARVPERGLGELGTWTRGDERPARTSANSRNLAGRCRCARVLCATTGGTCGAMLRCGHPRPRPIRLSFAPPLEFAAASVVALYTSHSSPRVLKARLGKHSCQRCHRAHAQLRLKTPGSCVTAELRFSAAERPSAPYSARTALQSSRKQRPAPRARHNTKTKTPGRGQEGRKKRRCPR